MTVQCKNGEPHTHESAKESKECWGRTSSAARKVGLAQTQDPRLQLIESMMDLVREGYFATQTDGDARVNFLRISRPIKGDYAGCVKLMTQHGPRFKNAVILWPPKPPTSYNPKGQPQRWEIIDHSAIELMMLVIADPKGCAMRYGQLGHCCQCNTELTDPRSIHYGIGPDCEENWPDIIEGVDEENDGKSYEMLTRGW